MVDGDEKVARQLDSVSETLDLAMTGIRKSVHELHDDSIDVSIAIGDIIKTLPGSFDVEVNTSIDSPADNDTKKTRSMLRITSCSSSERIAPLAPFSTIPA